MWTDDNHDLTNDLEGFLWLADWEEVEGTKAETGTPVKRLVIIQWRYTEQCQQDMLGIGHILDTSLN